MLSPIRSAWPLLVAVILLAGNASAQQSNDTITMYKTPGCGCCEKWAEHLRAAGFRVDARDAPNLNAVRRELGVPPRLAGCHTAKVGRYVVQGHVPAQQIERLLQEQPDDSILDTATGANKRWHTAAARFRGGRVRNAG